MPHLIFELSTALLTRLVQVAVSNRVPCPSGKDIYTDIDITEVMAFRGDDVTFGFFLNQIAQDLRDTIDPSAELELTRVVWSDGEFRQIPAIFLLVSGSARVFDTTDLAAEKSSSPPGDPFAITFGRVQPGGVITEKNLPPVLMTIDLSFAPDTQDVKATVSIVSVFAPYALNTQNTPEQQNINASIQLLRGLVSNQVLDLPLANVLDDQNLSIAGVHLSTEEWQGGLQDAGTRGLRLGIDFALDDVQVGLADFYDKHAWLKPDTEEWLLRFSDAGLTGLAEAVAGPLLDATEDLRFGNSYRHPEVSASWNGTELTVNFPVYWNKIDIKIGEVDLTIRPTAGSKLGADGLPRVSLHIHLCPDFDLDPGAGFLIFLTASTLLTAIGALMGGALGALAGAIFGTAVGIGLAGFAQNLGSQAAADYLADADELGDCTAPDSNDCRDCDWILDRPLANAGTMQLGRVTPDQFGLTLAGPIAWSNGKPRIEIGRMEAKLPGIWLLPIYVCNQGAIGPYRQLVIWNRGELPLTVCSISDLTARGGGGSPKSSVPTKPLLYFSAGSATAPPFVVQPGSGVSVMVEVDTNSGSFVPGQPIPVEIITSGGALILDLVGDQQYPPIESVADANRRRELAEIICNTLHERKFPVKIWRQIRFTDPLPFRPQDRVIERITMETVGVRGQTPVTFAGINGSRLAQFGVSGGRRIMAFDLRRMGGASHGTTAFRISTDRPETLRKSAESHRFARILYREAGWHSTRAKIDGVERIGDHLIVHSGGSLRTYNVMLGRLSLTGILRTGRVLSLARMGDKEVIAATEDGIFAIDERLELHEISRRRFNGVAVGAQTLWAMEEKSIQSFLKRGGRWVRGRGVPLRDATHLVGTGKGLFGLRNGILWKLAPGKPQSLRIQGERLESREGRLALISTDGTALLDEKGGTVARYHSGPAGNQEIVDFPARSAAVLVRKSAGLLMLLDRYETPLDLAGQPEAVIEHLKGMKSRRGS